MSKQKFYLTTPIYYVNARPHIGHAYTTLAADVITRRHRLLGDDTFFLTGTDEHGQKIERSAAAAGIAPQQFADQVSAQFESLWKRMGITNNDYIRTTEDRHKRGVQKLWQLLCDRDKIYLSTYTGQYSIGEEMFVEGPPGTIGPDGKPTETVTEENYFFKLSDYQTKLIDLIESNELSIQPEVRKNEVLSFLRGNVADASETKSSNLGNPYVKGALKDLSISRSSFKWGIPVPGDEKHVIYVWLDALANYMTAIGYGSDDPIEQEKFKKYWPADLHLVGKEIIRFHCVYWPAFLLAAGLRLPKAITAHGWLLFEDSKMSKSRGNIVRTETILDAFGTLKPSEDLTDEAWKKEQDLFASDVLRYFLLREIPFGQDGSFSFDALVQRYNSDLANGYGNLVSRTLNLIVQYFSSASVMGSPRGIATYLRLSEDNAEIKAPFDPALKAQTEKTVEMFGDLVEENDFNKALESIWTLVAATDAFVTKAAPWKTLREFANAEASGTVELLSHEHGEQLKILDRVLYVSAESIRIITALLYPILPYATARVWSQLGLGDIEESARKGELKNLEWGGLKPGTKLGALSPIFPRADKGLIQIMTDMEISAQPTPSKFVDEKTAPTIPVPTDPTHPGAGPRTGTFETLSPGTTVGGSHAILTERPVNVSHSEALASGLFANSSVKSDIPDTPQIAIDDFIKIDLRVAQVLIAERIPKADKLLRLEVDLGYEKRQILSGIAEWYTPEELIGKKIVVIANLAPRKMRGLESHGMLLAASSGENGKPILATFGEDIALGSRLR
jgi:methionyl-tRNA synthetase